MAPMARIPNRYDPFIKSSSTTNLESFSSAVSHYDKSYRVSATKLWNLLPAKVNSQTALEPFKVALGTFLKSFPDTPPTDGYTSATNNSLLEWNLQKNRHQEYMEDVRDTVVQK